MKTEVVFQLDGASWPALLVMPDGAVEDSNPAAQTFFGDRLASKEFSAIAAEETASSGFLTLCYHLPTPVMALKFRGSDGDVTTFNTSIAPLNLGGQTYFLFQLYPMSVLAANGAGKPADHKSPSVETNAAQKQKLDCAMQLTRTVALDFNNALTTILGHGSYVLGQMEESHKWRSSLGEIEKAAERASEVANDLASFSLDEKNKKSQIEGNLNVLVRRAVQLLQTSDGKNVVWSEKFEKEMYTVHFEEAKLQQAFVKILENAADAIGNSAQVNGQITVETRNVDVTERRQDGLVQLTRGAYVCVEIGD